MYTNQTRRLEDTLSAAYEEINENTEEDTSWRLLKSIFGSCSRQLLPINC